MPILLSLLGLLAAGAAYQFLGTLVDCRRYKAPGRLIAVDGGRRLHLNEQGSGNPVVVLEAGIAATSLSWAFVQPQIAQFARVLSYDRAGLGWSDPPSTQPTAQTMATDLNRLLHRAGYKGPFILVGHSFGGLLVRAYAALYPGEIAGVVLVDPVSLEYWAACSPAEQRRLAIGTKLSRRGAVLARFGIVRFALALMAGGARRLPQLIGRIAAGPGAAFMERLLGQILRLPHHVLPLVRSHWSQPKSFVAMAATLQALPQAAQTNLAKPIPAEIPCTILSASTATQGERNERDRWARQSEHGKHLRLHDSGHWLPLEQPATIVSAVRDLLAEK